jgi:restriction system protein
MSQNEKDMPRAKKLAAKLMLSAFKILKDSGGQLAGRDVMVRIEKALTLDDWEKARYEKSGHIRWQSVLHFYSIGCIKAGYLRKHKGTWFLSPEGEESIKLGEAGLIESVEKAYREWRERNQPNQTDENIPESLPEEKETSPSLTLDQNEDIAFEGIRDFIFAKPPYEFQDLVAALMRGMGYYIPFVAPPGKDGGVDIIAYLDPLGTKSPRIKIQVKHRPNGSVSIPEIRQLIGTLGKDGDVGMLVCSGTFTRDSIETVRHGTPHVELVDIRRLISLWQEFYPKLSDEDKNLLPLRPIYFLEPML